MHELGIAKDMWALIKEYAKDKKITKIIIVLGEASGIEEDFLRHSFESHIMPGSQAEGAVLEIHKEKLAAKCIDCEHEITKENLSTLRCPGCNGLNIAIVTGKETYVKGIEVE